MTKFRKMYIGAFALTVATAFSGVATAGTCGACRDDAQIEASIKDSFQRLPYLGAPNSIQVQTIKHVVYLSGEVSAGLMSRTAAEIAQGTPNVERVVNTISVTK
jgi:osmotically-inducible protein OsmY